MRNRFPAGAIMSALVLFFMSCTKTLLVGTLTEPPSNVQYMVDSSNAYVSWTAPGGEFDNYTLELSKFEDFSVLNYSKMLEKDKNAYVFRKLDLGETYHFRIRANRSSPPSQSPWAVVNYSTNRNNILMPILPEHIVGNEVTIAWDFSKDNSLNASQLVTRILLTPVIGAPREIILNSQEKTARKVKVGNLAKDELYTVRIYNEKFARGMQTFATNAESVNGVWTLSPHSNLLSVIERAVNGDIIALRPGIYDLSNATAAIENKMITIRALSAIASDMPKLYARGFILNGLQAGLTLKGIDVSGSRLDAYKRELPNTADSRWNAVLVMVNASSGGFDAFVVEDCKIRNYWTGIFNLNDNNRPPHKVGKLISIDNSLVYHIGGDKAMNNISINAGDVAKGVFTNSTFYMAGRMFTLIDAERNPAIKMDFTFKNNTVDNSWASGSFDFKAVKAPAKALLQNNIFSNVSCSANFFPNWAYVANNFDKRLINCNFFNVTSKSTIYGSNQSNMPVHSWELRHPNTIWNEVKPAFVINDAQHANPNSIKEYPVAIDPGYRNALNMDFTISSGSPLRNLGGGNAIGDPRWW